jgi:hypothetical protein
VASHKRIRWTPGMIARLRWHAAAGHTMAEAARDLGVSRGAVAVQACNHSIGFSGNCAPLPPAMALAQEIAAARAEAVTAPPYRDPSAWPR